MSRLTSMLVLVVLGASSAAVADVAVRANVKINLPSVVVRDRDRPAPRGYIKFDDPDPQWERQDRARTKFDVGGTYTSKYGPVTLTQDGNRVTGSYESGPNTGMVKGVIRGNAIYYRWRQQGSEGHGVWYLSGRNRNISGTWGTFQSNNNAGQWDLQRAPDAGPPGDRREERREERREDRRDDRR